MYPSRSFRFVSALLLACMLMTLIAPVAMAQSDSPPLPVYGPRVKPPPIPHTSVLNPTDLYNLPRVPQNTEARAAYEEQGYYYAGAGVNPTVTDISSGLTLHKSPTPMCFSFNDGDLFASKWQKQNGGTDIWSDYYQGWGPFAVDDGIRQSKNTTFSLERSIGPGKNYGKGYSLKIASNQPYAGGWASPLLAVEPGATVTVSAKYLIYNWTQRLTDNEVVHDWASLGVKANPATGDAVYVNGFRRGEWATLSQTFTAGDEGSIMILIQGESTGAVNSNIYFDDIELIINGEHHACE